MVLHHMGMKLSPVVRVLPDGFLAERALPLRRPPARPAPGRNHHFGCVPPCATLPSMGRNDFQRHNQRDG